MPTSHNTAACPVMALDAAAAGASAHGDRAGYERLHEASLSIAPRSLEGAHTQLIGLDLLLEEFATDHDALDEEQAQDNIARAKAIVERLLAFTSAATGLPA